MKYTIPVENMEDLRKKVASITKKAEKHGVTITFVELGEVVKKVKTESGKTVLRKYMMVEAEGEAKFEGWVFAGTIEHTEHGNILRSVSEEYRIPERYKDAEPYCEHCKTIRYRKDTYVVYNEETGEFKQVGKSCLKEYTKGLSAEMVAFVLQWDKEIQTACDYIGSSYIKVYEVAEISKYFAEAISKFGWCSSQAGGDSTKAVAMDFWSLDHDEIHYPETVRMIRDKADKFDFNPAHISDEYIESALAWARGWDGHQYNDYRDNLKVIASMRYCEYKHLGYLASLFMAYDKEMAREIKKMERAKNRANSEYISEAGKRITVAVKSAKCLTSWETMYGVTCLYEFVTDDDNILIWKTSKYLDNIEKITSITGTVKEHKEYNGIKQTELTRCKTA